MPFNPDAHLHKHESSIICIELKHILDLAYRERSGSVVECLTQDRGAAGYSLTGVTALRSLSKKYLSSLSIGTTQEDLSLFN